MKKQMKWGLATLILLLGIAAVFLFIDKDTNTEPKMTLGQPTKDLLKKGVKSPQEVNAPDGTTENGHAEPHADTPAQVDTEEQMPTEAEIEAYHKIMKETLPGRIEQVQKLRDNQQELYDGYLRLSQNAPDLYRETVEKHRKFLNEYNTELSSLTKLWRNNYENE